MAEAAADAPRRAASASMVGFTYRRVPADRAGPAARRRRAARRDPARARAVPAGLDRRPGRADVLAAGEGEGRLRRARRHRRAHRRPHPVHHRPDAHRGQRAARDVRQGAARCPAAAGKLGGVGRRGDGRRSPSTTPRSSSAGSPAARWPPSRRPASRSAARTRIRIEINGSAGSLAFDFEDMNVLQFFDGAEPAETAGLPPDPRHRARAPVRRRLVAGRARPRLRARLHPPGRRPGRPRIAEGERPDAVVRRRAAGAAGARRRRAQRRRRHRLDRDLADRTIRRPTRRTAPMPRPITLFTGQWADLPFEEVCRLASGWGYDGLEIACWGDHLDVERAAERRLLRRRSGSTLLERHGLQVCAISNHLNGQAVCDDPIDERHRGILHAAGLGRRRPRGRAAAGGRGDEADRPGGRASSASTPSSASPGRRSGRPSRCSRRCPSR